MPKNTQLKQARLKRKVRKPREWTIEATAKKLDISDNYLTRLENGINSNPDMEILNRIIKLYGNNDGKKIIQDFLDIEL